MLQNHGDAVLADACRYVVENRLRLFRAAGVVAVHVPVEILEARVLHRSGQQTHQPHVAVGADGVGAAAGEAHQGGFDAGIPVNNVLHPQQVRKIRLRTGINALVNVGHGVNADAVSPAHDLLHHFAVAPVGDKEGGLHAVAVQHVQQLLRVGAGAVVEGQINDLSLGPDDLGTGNCLHLHGSCDGGRVFIAVGHSVGHAVGSGRQPVHLAVHLHLLGQVAVHVVQRGVPRLLIKGASGDGHIRVALQRDLRRDRVIIGHLPLRVAGISGGIRHRVNDLPVFLRPNHPVGDVAVIIVDGPVARLLIGRAGKQRPARVGRQDDFRAYRVHNTHDALCLGVHSPVIRRVGKDIFPRFFIIDLALNADRNILRGHAVLPEQRAADAEVCSRVLKMPAVFQHHFRFAVQLHGKRKPVCGENKGHRAQQQDKHCSNDQYPLFPASARLSVNLFLHMRPSSITPLVYIILHHSMQKWKRFFKKIFER